MLGSYPVAIADERRVRDDAHRSLVRRARARACRACAPTTRATTWSRCAGAFGAGAWSSWGPTRIRRAVAGARARRCSISCMRCIAIPIRSAAISSARWRRSMASTIAQMLLGNGSHELLMQLAQVFAGPGDEVVCVADTASRCIALATQAAGATLRACAGVAARPRDDAARATTSTRWPQRSRRARKLVYLANPNNPTGTWFGRDGARGVPAQRAERRARRRRRGLRGNGRCAGRTPARCRCWRTHPNLVVTRTFSKAYALAGLRVGYLRRASGTGRGDGTRARKLQRQRPGAGRVRSGARRRGAPGMRAWRATPRNARALAEALRARGCFVHPVADQFPAGRIRRATRRASKPSCSRAAWCCGRWAATACRDCLRITVGDARREPPAARRAGRGARMSARRAATGSPRPARRCAALRVPGDKSVSHRAIMLGALAEGTTRVERLPRRRGHARHRARCSSSWACASRRPAPASASCTASACTACAAPAQPLDCGNAGTGMRLLAGLLAGQALRQRADRRRVAVAAADAARASIRWRAMGARIDSADGGLPPLRIHGGSALQGIDYTLAGRERAGEVGGAAGRPVRARRDRGARTASRPATTPSACWPRSAGRSSSRPATRACSGGHRLRATDVAVPADFSSAAFFLVAASVVPGSELVLRSGRHESAPHRPAAPRCGDGRRHSRTEPRASRAANRSPTCSCGMRRLHGIDVPVALVPDMIDEFPALFVAAACAQGRTHDRAARPSCGSRNPTASRRWRRACARSACAGRRNAGRRDDRRRRPARRHGRQPRRPPHRDELRDRGAMRQRRSAYRRCRECGDFVPGLRYPGACVGSRIARRVGFVDSQLRVVSLDFSRRPHPRAAVLPTRQHDRHGSNGRRPPPPRRGGHDVVRARPGAIARGRTRCSFPHAA